VATTHGLVAATVNGRPGLLWMRDGGVVGVVAITVDGGRVVAVHIVRDPDKLQGLR
jgi:RNA polymerase sigma-70 factor (ECF subfamily)